MNAFRHLLVAVTAVAALAVGCASPEESDATEASAGAQTLGGDAKPSPEKLRAYFDQAQLTFGRSNYQNDSYTADHNDTRCSLYNPKGGEEEIPAGDVYAVDAKSISSDNVLDARGRVAFGEWDIPLINKKTKSGRAGARASFRVQCVWHSDVAEMTPEGIVRTLENWRIRVDGPHVGDGAEYSCLRDGSC